MRKFGREFSAIRGDFCFFDWFKKTKFHALFRSGRDAIGFMAGLLREKEVSPIVYMPALCCESMYIPFLRNGFEVKFYDLDSDFQPKDDIWKIESGLLFLMNYYGFNSFDSHLSELKKRSPDVRIVVDLTHAPYDGLWYDSNVDFSIASLRKTYPIVNGGMLSSFSKEWDKKTPLFCENVFTECRRKALEGKAAFLLNGDFKEEVEFVKDFERAEEDLNRFFSIYSADEDSVAALKHLDCAYIKAARKYNYQTLLSELHEVSKLRIPCKMNPNLTPFAFPVFVERRDEIRKNLAERGVFAPVLWPLSSEIRAASLFAASVEKSILAIPIDQRYNREDMLDVAGIIKEIIV